MPDIIWTFADFNEYECPSTYRYMNNIYEIKGDNLSYKYDDTYESLCFM